MVFDVREHKSYCLIAGFPGREMSLILEPFVTRPRVINPRGVRGPSIGNHWHRSSLTIVVVIVIVRYIVRCVDEAFWMSVGKSELDEALNVAVNNRIAKNVMVFIGDGMGPNTVTATRIYKHGESGRMTFERFPHMGLLKVSDARAQRPGEASRASRVRVFFFRSSVLRSNWLNRSEVDTWRRRAITTAAYKRPIRK